MIRQSIFFFCFFCLQSLSGQVAVFVEVDTSNLLIGDHLRYRLFLEILNGTEIDQINYQSIESNDNIELIEVNEMIQSDDQFFTQDLILTSFDSGFHYIPPLTVIYERNGRVDSVKTNAIPISVRTIPITSDTTSIRPIKQIITEPLRFSDFLPYLLAILGVIIVASVVVSIWYRRKNSPEVERRAPIKTRPAHEIALEQIKELREKQLWQKGEIKAFQTELTHIVRAYLESRFNIPALGSTTVETLKNIQSINIGKQWIPKLRTLFNVADLVKFAKAKPPADFHEKVLADAEQFIHETKPMINLPEENTGDTDQL